MRKENKDTEFIIMEVPKRDGKFVLPEGSKIIQTLNTKEQKSKMSSFLDGIAVVASSAFGASGKAIQNFGKTIYDRRGKTKFTSKEFGSNEEFNDLDDVAEDFIEDDRILDNYPQYRLPGLGDRRFVDDRRTI